MISKFINNLKDAIDRRNKAIIQQRHDNEKIMLSKRNSLDIQKAFNSTPYLVDIVPSNHIISLRYSHCNQCEHKSGLYCSKSKCPIDILINLSPAMCPINKWVADK
jgi:hypothetical protein